MNTWHNNVSRIRGIRDIHYNMPIAHNLYTVITRPGIRSKHGSPSYVVPDESPKARCRQVRNLYHTNSARTTATHFRRYCNDRFSFSTSTTNLGPDSPDVCFINLNLSGQLIPSRTHHRTTQFMEPTPCSIITAKTKDSLQSESTGSMLLTRHKPHGEKPCPERFVTPMKQGSRSDGGLAFAFSAEKKTTPHQGGLGDLFPTTGANKTVRPSKFRNKFMTRTFGAKPVVKILECSRIINAGNRVPWLFHDHILHLVVG